MDFTTGNNTGYAGIIEESSFHPFQISTTDEFELRIDKAVHINDEEYAICQEGDQYLVKIGKNVNQYSDFMNLGEDEIIVKIYPIVEYFDEDPYACAYVDEICFNVNGKEIIKTREQLIEILPADKLKLVNIKCQMAFDDSGWASHEREQA